MNVDELNASGVRQSLQLQARCRGYEGAEAVYRCLPMLRDQMPADAKLHLAVMLDWACDGISETHPDNASDLAALRAAYTFARNVLIESAIAAGDDRLRSDTGNSRT